MTVFGVTPAHSDSAARQMMREQVFVVEKKEEGCERRKETEAIREGERRNRTENKRRMDDRERGGERCLITVHVKRR
eukprot:930168-Rhodomonas_salina.4